MPRCLRLVLFLILIFACGGSSEPPPEGPVASVEITPGNASIPDGLTVKLAAQTRNADGEILTGRAIAWSSTNPDVAKVDDEGLVVGAGEGEASIVAVSEGQSGAAEVAVTSNPPASIEIQPGAAEVKVQHTVQLTAVVKDAAGRTMLGRVIGWSTSEPAIAAVDTAGLVEARGLPGTATITASVGALSASAEIVTFRLPVAEVRISPAGALLIPGDSLALSHRVFDADGDPTIPTGEATWSSSNPAAALVEVTGEPFDRVVSLKSAAPGATTVEATVDAAVGSVEFSVIAPPTYTTLSAGTTGGPCALTATGTALCWVRSFRFNGADFVPDLQVRGPPGDVTFTEIETGAGFQCGLTAGGTVYCWGTDGELLGRGTREPSDVPLPVAGGHVFASLSSHAQTTCALTTAGEAYCWGLNNAGQLGGPSTDSCHGRSCSLVPALVSGGISFSLVTAGTRHSCGLTTTGQAYCWGENWAGQLGDGTTSENPSSTPRPVVGGLLFTHLSAGGRVFDDHAPAHTCGLTAAGAAYCWGHGGFAQLGNGTHENSSSPVPVAGGLRFTQIDVAYLTTCALATDGTAYCWGDYGNGGLGRGQFLPTTIPVVVAGGFTWRAIDAGANDQNCGITTAGTVYCWGQLIQPTPAPMKLPGQP